MNVSQTNSTPLTATAPLNVGGSLRNLVRQAKRIEGVGNVCLGIQDQTGVTLGYLRPIEQVMAGDAQLVEQLTRWRRQASQYFFTQFQPTTERTGSWLKDYLNDDSRLLFLACDTRRQTVGHLGLRQLQTTSAELDNVLRGSQDGRRGFMFLASAALLRWLFGSLGMATVTLRVLADNERAIHLYRLLGFESIETTPLRCDTAADEIRYVVDAEGTLPLSDKSALTMTLDRASFFQQLPWLRQQ